MGKETDGRGGSRGRKNLQRKDNQGIRLETTDQNTQKKGKESQSQSCSGAFDSIYVLVIISYEGVFLSCEDQDCTADGGIEMLGLDISEERSTDALTALAEPLLINERSHASPLCRSRWLHETLALLTSQLRPDANHKEEMVFLKDVFSEKSLGYLMKIHEKLRQYEKQSPIPILHSASTLAEDVSEELQSGPMSVEEKELLLLLTSPHLKAVLSVHDTVAQKNFDPVLPPLPDDYEDELDEESIKIVRLVKNKEPLSQSQGSITLKIIPAIKEEDKLQENKVFMRALFDYTPQEDKATPCQEAGLPFQRGDVLQVVSQDDQTWWQAKRIGDCSLRAGLIPSKHFQERRLAYRIKMGTLQSSKSPSKAVYDQGCDKGGCPG
ncbi:hypothetical protein DNTS_014933 [Danionella cerebrum]|uniref:SH3 domain-containing protein n=1 Tax=Danionella cerebrum TaxID=2873325 RepID=A0A553Q2A0_9TELE|nr:hypothetical protein DNTS_014933 [Danionella translucida]TRY84070.1 hypothetical protein DNTS_014933 [Danionella translucida]